VLAENAEDAENTVRFAVHEDGAALVIRDYLEGVIAGAAIEKVMGGVVNPVLSKLKVNDESRYML
jgi:hypothetical protein